MKKTIFYAFLLGSLSSKVWGQDTIRVSKQDLVNKISEQNLQVKLSRHEVKLAEADLLQARAAHLPNITASYTAMNTNSPLMAFGTKLNQSRIEMADFNPDYLNKPKSITNFNTKLEVQQPIFNKDAVFQKKAGQAKVNALQIKSERTTEYMKFEIAKAYMQLQLAYKAVEVLENAKKTVLANKKVIDNYHKNGMIQKSEVLYMNVRVTEIDNQLQYAKSNVRNASDYINFLTNDEYANVVLEPVDGLVYQENILENNPKLNIERKDLLAYAKSLDAYQLMIESSKAKFLPRLNAFGQFELNDNKIYQFGGKGYMVGLQLSWNIFDGYKANSEQAKYLSEISKTQTEILEYQKKSQLELNKAYRQVLDADNKVSLTKMAWEQSQEAYRIRKNRFDQGLEKSADLLSAETQTSQKMLDHQQAIFEYNTAVEYFRFLN